MCHTKVAMGSELSRGRSRQTDSREKREDSGEEERRQGKVTGWKCSLGCLLGVEAWKQPCRGLPSAGSAQCPGTRPAPSLSSLPSAETEGEFVWLARDSRPRGEARRQAWTPQTEGDLSEEMHYVAGQSGPSLCFTSSDITEEMLLLIIVSFHCVSMAELTINLLDFTSQFTLFTIQNLLSSLRLQELKVLPCAIIHLKSSYDADAIKRTQFWDDDQP